MMIEKNDPTWSATVRWVFGFIKFQLRCGQTLNEIEASLTRAVDSGELYSFAKAFEEHRYAYSKEQYERERSART